MIYGTNPYDWDTDGDGLSDFAEIELGTYPNDRDSDNDDMPDGDEISYGTDPNDWDSDDDGIDDGVEVLYVDLNPLVSTDGVADFDNDGLSNAYELNSSKTDIFNEDTDGDGLLDGAEENGSIWSNPQSEDSDGDGLNDNEEIQIGTNPTNEDSDYDDFSDGWEEYIRLYPRFVQEPEFMFRTNYILNNEEYCELLAKAIPALSGPAGSRKICVASNMTNVINVDMNNYEGITVWPEQEHENKFSERWLHSDIKNVAYPYLYLIFDYIIKEGGLK